MRDVPKSRGLTINWEPSMDTDQARPAGASPTAGQDTGLLQPAAGSGTHVRREASLLPSHLSFSQFTPPGAPQRWAPCRSLPFHSKQRVQRFNLETSGTHFPRWSPLRKPLPNSKFQVFLGFPALCLRVQMCNIAPLRASHSTLAPRLGLCTPPPTGLTPLICHSGH